MKQAVNAWALSGSVGFEETFSKVKAAGFDAVELNLDADGAHALTMDTTATDCKAILEISRRHALPISGVSTSLSGSIASADAAERKAAQAVLKQQIMCAKALECPVVLTVPGAGGTDWGAAQENAVQAFSEMKSFIEDSGITVGVENVWNGFFLSPRDMSALVDAVDSKSFGVYFDIGNCADRSQSEDWIRFLGSRIVRMHIKNFRRISVFAFAFIPLYESGTISWDKVMAAIREIGYDDTLTAEYGAPEGDPSPELLKNAAAIQQILKGEMQ